MPGWDSEWRELNTARRNSMGTNGREVPVLVSQTSVVGEAECGGRGQVWHSCELQR